MTISALAIHTIMATHLMGSETAHTRHLGISAPSTVAWQTSFLPRQQLCSLPPPKHTLLASIIYGQPLQLLLALCMTTAAAWTYIQVNVCRHLEHITQTSQSDSTQLQLMPVCILKFNVS